jgi:DNA-dependent RNA polymerase auxiliary subunit epsilon
VLRETKVPENAQTPARENLVALRVQLHATSSKPGVTTSLETKAHLAESISRIDEALKASMQRSAF